MKIDQATFGSLTMHRFRGAMAAAALMHGEQPTAEQIVTLNKDDPTVREIAEFFRAAGCRIDLSVTQMPTEIET